MGELVGRIETQIRDALKAGRTAELSALRLIKSELISRRLELRVADLSKLTDEVIFEVLGTMVKKREKAIEMFEQGNRKDLADTERGEIAVINSFLPAELSAEDLGTLVGQLIAELGASSMGDMGKVMAALKGRPGVSAALASKLVKERLGG